VVRNGYLPERKVQTGIGEVEVRVPKVRDRSGGGARSRSPAGGEPKPQKSEIGGCNFLRALFGRCSGDVPKQVVPAVENAVSSLALRGRVRTYQVQPTARTQRLSTLSSAVNSMQAAFSLAATLPAHGVGLTAGASAARTAVGMAEAVEQSPIIVGYADRHAAWTVGTENTEAFIGLSQISIIADCEIFMGSAFGHAGCAVSKSAPPLSLALAMIEKHEKAERMQERLDVLEQICRAEEQLAAVDGVDHETAKAQVSEGLAR
jgi:hypothetical protein